LCADIFIEQQPVTAGAIVAVNEKLARYLVGAGRAEYVNTAQPVTAETAAIEAPEKAVQPKAKKRQG